MMRSIGSLLEVIAVPAFLAMLGGLARVCRHGTQSWKQFFGSIVVSGFTGIVVHLVLQETQLSSSLQAALVAASGYSGGAMLDGYIARLEKLLPEPPPEISPTLQPKPHTKTDEDSLTVASHQAEELSAPETGIENNS